MHLGLVPPAAEPILTAARLHDIGTIGLPSGILTKAGGITPAEWQAVHQHPEVVAEGTARMGDFWLSNDEDQEVEAETLPDRVGKPADPAVRKQQITIRLDPEMIVEARQIAARKGIGHHTLLRMWVMEGITRAYQEGLLEEPPRSWAGPPRRGASGPSGLSPRSLGGRGSGR